jgi:copper chaperone CopZ
MAGTPRPARIVHHVPGRLRIKVEGVHGEDEFFETVQRLIAVLPGVESVRINPVSASVVVSYDAGDAGFAQRLPAHRPLHEWLLWGELGAVADAVATIAEAGLKMFEHHSLLAESVVTTAERLDRDVRSATGGVMDLKLLLPLALAAASALRETRTRGTPMWLTLSTFAFNTFITLHRNRIDGPNLSTPVAPSALPLEGAPPVARQGRIHGVR